MAAVLFFIPTVFISQAVALTIKDRRGASHTFTPPLKRVVFHINYEFIPALGIWDRVVGLGNTGYTNDLVLSTLPANADIPIIGDLNKINVEQILKAKPDAVITWSYNKDELDFIEQKTKIPMIAYYPYNLGEFYEMFTTIGTLLGRKQRTQEIINEMETIFKMIKIRSNGIPQKQRKKILWIGGKPTMVCGKLDPRNDIMCMVGAENPAAEIVKKAGEVSLEQIIAWNPDLLFIVWHAPYSADDILGNRQWRHVNAVRNKKIYKAPPWSTWSPRLAPIALWMAVRTYPELYRDIEMNRIVNDFFQKVFNTPYGSVQPIEN